MLRKNFCFFKLSLFLTNTHLSNCAELQHKTTTAITKLCAIVVLVENFN